MRLKKASSSFKPPRRVPVDSPARFRIELLFSPGAQHNPYEVVPLKQDHTLPVLSRIPMHKGAQQALLCIVLCFAVLKRC